MGIELEHHQPKVGHMDNVPRFPFFGTTATVANLVEFGDTSAVSCYMVHLEPALDVGQSYHEVAEEMIFVMSGAVTISLGSEQHVLSQGSYVYIPPRVRHGFVTHETGATLLSVLSPKVGPNLDLFLCHD